MKQRMILGGVLLSAVLGFGLYGITGSLASGRYDDDDDDDRYRSVAGMSWIVDERFALYQEECGSCHLAYPPQLLPPPSWRRIMDGLEDHFGENAELDDASHRQIAEFLSELSTPRSGEYRRVLRNLDAQKAPLRITEMTYFKRKHREIPDRFVRGNDKVRSFSQCDACHRGAERGDYDEDRVVIPGVGRWDD